MENYAISSDYSDMVGSLIFELSDATDVFQKTNLLREDGSFQAASTIQPFEYDDFMITALGVYDPILQFCLNANMFILLHSYPPELPAEDEIFTVTTIPVTLTVNQLAGDFLAIEGNRFSTTFYTETLKQASDNSIFSISLYKKFIHSQYKPYLDSNDPNESPLSWVIN